MTEKIKKHLEFSCFFIKVYLMMVFSMLTIRFYFLYRNFEYIKEQIPMKTYIKSFFIGWIFDNSIISYLMILMILFFLIYFVFQKLNLGKLGKFLWLTPIVLFQAIIYIVSILDVQYYNEFGFHMNSSINDYKANTKEIIATAFTSNYNPITNLSLIIIVIALNIFLIKVFLNSYEKKKKYSFSVHIANVVSGILLIGFCVIGSRGGLGSVTLSWGRAYFSQYEFANQMTLNGAYSLFKSYYYTYKKNHEGAIKKDYSLEESAKIVKDSLLGSNEKLLNGKNPILREVTTGKTEKKYNVVVLLLESWSYYGISSLGGPKDLTPNFDKLTKEGTYYTNFYANGGRSNRGITSVSVSYPSPLDETITKDVVANQESFLSLASLLKDRGYNTNFIYGGDAHFDNMHGFLMKNGMQNIVDVANFGSKDKTIKWGVPDDKLFNFGLDYMDKLKEPFFVNYFTLSNHGPYDTDPSFKFNKTNPTDEMFPRDRAFAFSDYALGKFIESVRTKKYAQNTIFVFVADHGFGLKNYKSNDPRFFHIPLFIWSPNKELVKPQIAEKVGSQVDILPTVMGYLGGTYKSGAWGQDLSLENRNNYAFISNGDAYGIIDKDNYYYQSKMEGEKLINKNTFQEITNKELKEKYKKTLNGHIDLMFYQREQAIFGNK